MQRLALIEDLLLYTAWCTLKNQAVLDILHVNWVSCSCATGSSVTLRCRLVSMLIICQAKQGNRARLHGSCGQVSWELCMNHEGVIQDKIKTCWSLQFPVLLLFSQNFWMSWTVKTRVKSSSLSTFVCWKEAAETWYRAPVVVELPEQTGIWTLPEYCCCRSGVFHSEGSQMCFVYRTRTDVLKQRETSRHLHTHRRCRPPAARVPVNEPFL